MKNDAEIKALIIELLEDNVTGGGDLDGLIRVDGNFYILEFLRCVSVPPLKSHPKYYWNSDEGKIGNKRKFLSLWRLAQETGSRLFLINYDDNRSAFKIIEVLEMSDQKKISKEIITEMNLSEFGSWFTTLVKSGN